MKVLLYTVFKDLAIAGALDGDLRENRHTRASIWLESSFPQD
jgi:hypothetical protein